MSDLSAIVLLLAAFALAAIGVRRLAYLCAGVAGSCRGFLLFRSGKVRCRASAFVAQTLALLIAGTFVTFYATK